MARLSAILRSVKTGNGLGVAFYCPGCDRVHVINYEGDHAWTWNNDIDKPTFTPSILVTYNGADAGQPRRPPAVCHSFVTDGNIQFLGDCTHGLANQTVPLPPFPPELNV